MNDLEENKNILSDQPVKQGSETSGSRHVVVLENQKGVVTGQKMNVTVAGGQRVYSNIQQMDQTEIESSGVKATDNVQSFSSADRPADISPKTILDK